MTTLESIANKLDVEVDDLFDLDEDDLAKLSKKEKKFLEKKRAEKAESESEESESEESESEEGSSEEKSADEARQLRESAGAKKAIAIINDGEGSSVIDSSEQSESSESDGSSDEESNSDEPETPKQATLSSGKDIPTRGRKWSFIRATRDIEKFATLDDPIWNPPSMRKSDVSKDEMKKYLNTVILQKFNNLTEKNRVVMLLVDDTKATMRAFKYMSKRLKPKDVVLVVTVRPFMKTAKLTQKFSNKTVKYQYNLWRNTVLMQKQYATLLLNAKVDFCCVTPMYHDPVSLIKKMVKDYNVYGMYVGVHNKSERGKSQVRATSGKRLVKLDKRFHQKVQSKKIGCRVRLVYDE